ncbi:ABC transporter permease [Dactylosporangium sp. CA-233914]|uniref:ABC transporter permease n=1 Tax=Dactylosporangium sp. CA-233914 TaxID=3239934 RepID=UPI003D8E804D
MDPLAQDLSSRLLPPGSKGSLGSYPLGTDPLGRDMLSLLLAGARTIVLQSLIAVMLGATAGVGLGLVCGYFGGALGRLLMLLTNLQLAFPFFLLALSVVGILGPSFWLIVVVVALASWVELARVTYMEARILCQSEFVLAVRVMRGSVFRIILRHLLPNVAPSVLILSSLLFGSAIVTISGLGFVGLSLPGEVPNWGQMLGEGRAYITTAWWLTVLPGLAIFALVLCINVAAERLRSRLVGGRMS